VWVRVGSCARRDVSHQPLRPVRPPAGMVVSCRTAVLEPELQDAWTLPVHQASPLRRLVLRILDDADDDDGASGVCADDDVVHPACDSIRGARPREVPRAAVRGVPPSCPDAGPLRAEAESETRPGGCVKLGSRALDWPNGGHNGPPYCRADVRCAADGWGTRRSRTEAG